MLVGVFKFYPADFESVRVISTSTGSFKVSLSNRYESNRWLWLEKRQKEPETLKWIEEFMKAGETFVDIGACIGNYSIYAAVIHPGLKVFAFEPEPNSFIQLMKNVQLNNLPVTCFQIPLSSESKVDFLMTNPVFAKAELSKIGSNAFVAGESNHQFGRTQDSMGKKFAPSMRLGMHSSTLDSIFEVGLIPVPNHIKMDVDGLEDAILNGMKLILSRRELRSLLCELNQESQKNDEIVSFLQLNGLSCVHRPDSGRGNYIFQRKEVKE